MSTTALSKSGDIKSLINSEQMRDQFAKALPKHLSPERFARIAITATTRNPKLLECTPASVMKCLLDLSAAGLEPDGRRAHLIPYGKECTLVFDYKGKVELAMRCGNIASIHADKVCENDHFKINRGKLVAHEIDFRGERGEAYAYYCLITFKDGGEKCEVMTKSEVESIRNRSQGYKSAIQYNKSHPWLTDFDEMAKKTTFHRASKWIELSPEIREHFEKDYDLEPGIRNVTPSSPPAFILPKADDAQTPAIEAPVEDADALVPHVAEQPPGACRAHRLTRAVDDHVRACGDARRAHPARSLLEVRQRVAPFAPRRARQHGVEIAEHRPRDVTVSIGALPEIGVAKLPAHIQECRFFGTR